MPAVRPFRALRYAASAVGDLARVVAPPYDVISPAGQRELLARDPRNVVRLELPPDAQGDPPDERYRRAARTLAAWRSDGTLRAERRPALYVYEQEYPVPGTAERRTQRGFFGRLRLEDPGPGSGVKPHERTLEAPREDRYRLLRATGVNTSPVVGLFENPSGRVAARLATVARRAPDVEVVDDAVVRHRLWVVPETDPATGRRSPTARDLVGSVRRSTVTIADGHHRYATALRYRDERRVGAPPDDPDPAWDYVLMLFIDAAHEPLTVLPTHRIVRGLGPAGIEALWAGAGRMFEVRADVSSDDLRAGFGPSSPGGRGRFGLWTRGRGAVLTARRAAFAADLPTGGAAVRSLDVTLLGIALERLCGVTPEDVASGERLEYTHDASEAISAVDAATGGADAAFLLEPTPVRSVIAVAADGDVMPQKSTFFYPKALTGLVINPHEG